MASKEIKAALKAAREAIDKKEFQEALKHCKVVLRADKTNFNALVFVGVATSELQQPEQAYAAFTKATQLNPDHPLGWQGLADFCAKQKDPKYYKDMSMCYERLARLTESKDPGKSCGFAEKHGDSWLLREQPLQALTCWQEALEKLANLPEDVVDTKKPLLCSKVANAIMTQLPVEYEYIEQLCAVKLSADAGFMKDFILYLFRVLQVEDDVTINDHRYDIEGLVAKELFGMRSTLQEDVFCRQLLCLLALTRHLVCGGPLADDCPAISDELSTLQEGHAVSQLVSACSSLASGAIQEAHESIQIVLASRSTCPLTWYVTATVLLRMHAYTEACHAARQGLCSIGSSTSREYLMDPRRMKTVLQLCMAKTMMSEDHQSYEDAISMCNELCDQVGAGTDAELLLAKAYMLNGEASQASDICDVVLRHDRSNHYALYLQSCAEAACEHHRSAEESLAEAIELCPTASEYHLQLGRMLWDSHDEVKCLESRGSFLKAAQLDRWDSRPFYQLGLFYAEVEKNMGKALRCFQKAVDVNSGNLKAVSKLGECLQQQGLLTEALELYQKLTVSMPASQAHVAWYQLGSLQLDTGHPQEAIASLQTALRSEPRNGLTWEALGAAYMLRGSYASALKALLRAVQLSSSIFALCKIAEIKSKLGLNSEAIVDYRQLLESDDTYVPAWKGLAESYLYLAKDCMNKNFDNTAVACIGEVLSAIARAAALNPRLLCLWKLMGDACMLLAPLPSEVLESLEIPIFFQPAIPGSARARVLGLAHRAFAQCLHVCPDQQCKHWLWHDLGINYYEQMKDEAREEQRAVLAHKAIEAMQNAIRLCKTESMHWNSLGVFCTNQAINNMALAQHSFIKALQLQPNDAATWANLGVVYISQSNIELAHKAFAKAQAVDPEYVGGWLGQAMVAELMQHDEAQDLYRHAANLAYHDQAALGLAQWSCSGLLRKAQSPTAGDSESDGASRPSSQASSIPISVEDNVLDMMTKLAKRHPENNSSLSMLGLVLERRKLFTLAEHAYARVCSNLSDSGSDQSELDLALSNHARALCSCGRYAEAVEKFGLVAVPRQEDYCWWALACFHEKAKVADGTCVQLFEKALQLTTTPSDRSAIIAGAAMAAFRKSDYEQCKNFLLDSFRVEPASAVCQDGLCALTALALLLKDGTLATAALVELRKAHLTDVTMRASRTYIESVYRMLMRETDSGCKQWLKEIHRTPSDGELWSGLGRFLVQAQTQLSTCHQVTSTAALLKPALAPSTLLISSLSQLSSAKASALHVVQKAIMANPSSPHAWCALAACLASRKPVPSQQSPGSQSTSADDSSSVDESASVHVAPGEKPSTEALISMCYFKVKSGLENSHELPCQNITNTKAKSLQQVFSWLVVFQHFFKLRSGSSAPPLPDARLIAALPAAPQIDLRSRLLVLLSEAGQLLTTGTLNAAQLVAIRQTCIANHDTALAWQSLGHCYCAAGVPTAAELAYRQAVSVISSTGGNPGVVLLRLALLGLQQVSMNCEPEKWMALAKEAMQEALKYSRQSTATQVMQALVIFHSGNAKYAARLLNALLPNCVDNLDVKHLVQYYALRAQLKLKNYDTAKELVKAMQQSGSPYNMAAFQLFQSLG